jgi:hypothetical protein
LLGPPPPQSLLVGVHRDGDDDDDDEDSAVVANDDGIAELNLPLRIVPFVESHRGIVITQGAKTLIKLLNDGTEVVQMLSAWCLTNLTSDSTQYQVAAGKLGAIEACLPILLTCDNTGM